MKLGETIVALSPKRGDMELADPARGPRYLYDAGPVRIAYVYAPDGIQLELIQKRA